MKKSPKSKKRKTKKPASLPNTMVGIVYALASSAKNKTVKTRRLKIKRSALDQQIRELTESAQKDFAVCQALNRIMEEPDKKDQALKKLSQEERERARQLLEHAKT